jgi:hypothetical protein
MLLLKGKARMTLDRKVGADDLIHLNADGFIVNNHDRIVSPVVHQVSLTVFSIIQDYASFTAHKRLSQLYEAC